MFSSASTIENSRLGAEKDGGVAVRQVQVDVERALLGARQRRGDVDGDGRGADTALGAEKGKQIPDAIGGFLPDDALDGGSQVLDRQRFGDALADAGAHRFQDERAVRGRRTPAPSMYRDSGA